MNIHSIIFLIVGLALGLVIEWLLFRRIAKSKIDDFVEKVKSELSGQLIANRRTIPL